MPASSKDNRRTHFLSVTPAQQRNKYAVVVGIPPMASENRSETAKKIQTKRNVSKGSGGRGEPLARQWRRQWRALSKRGRAWATIRMGCYVVRCKKNPIRVCHILMLGNLLVFAFPKLRACRF